MAPPATAVAGVAPLPRRAAPRRRWVPGATAAAAAGAGLAAALIVAFLVAGVRSGPVDWAELVTSGAWDPARGRFGALAMVWGTAAVAAVALGLAAPLGWGAAVAVHEVAPRRWRAPLRAGCELLAVVPSIVYGLVGLAYLRPLVSGLTGTPGGDGLLTAGLVLAVMVLPTVVAVSVDALAAVPAGVREAAAGCGLTRSQVVRSAVLPLARRGMGAAALLALARALGETIAVFLLIGRADGRLPGSLGQALASLARPGQTLTTKLNGPEVVLAGTSGPHWAALCALALGLLVLVAALTAAGQRRRRGAGAGGAAAAGRGGGAAGLGGGAAGRGGGAGGRLRLGRRRAPGVRLPPATGRFRVGADRGARLGLLAVLAVPVLALAAVAAAVGARGAAALDPSFWWSASSGAVGGGVGRQLAGTLVLVAAAGVLAAPVGLGLGLLTAEYAGPRLSRALRTLTLTLGGVPSIVLGLWGYWLFSTRLGWGKSWLAGAVVLAVVAVPVVVVAVASAAASLPAERREAARSLGLSPDQVTRSVVLPHALPGLVTGLLLGLARAAGETAPLVFTATVFSGAPVLPDGVRHAPVAALPTHIFALAQDSVDPAAQRAAWGAALVLMAVAGALVVAAVPARRRLRRGEP